MKQLFIDLTDRLETLDLLRWIDEDKGQMNFDRPPIPFPAALTELQIPKTHDLNTKVQAHEVIVNVRLCFDFMGNTNKETPEDARLKSLGYYDIVEAVKNSLQGWSGESFNSLSFKGMYPEKRPDAYKIMVLAFATGYKDTNA